MTDFVLTVLTPERLAAILADLHNGLKKLFGEQMEAVYLYGSQARGDAKPGSDIDLLVVLNHDFDQFEMIEKTGDLVAHISIENDVVIVLAFMGVDDYSNQRTPFLMNVKREGIAV